MKRYQNTQIGYTIIFFLTIGMFFIIGWSIYGSGLSWIGAVVFLILGICLLMFYSLTVIVDENFLKIRFGLGLIKKRFPLKDIKSCRAVRSPWYYGWGLRILPNGVLYNVSGFDAVEIEMKSGKKHRIGTDKPDELEQAVNQGINQSVTS